MRGGERDAAVLGAEGCTAWVTAVIVAAASTRRAGDASPIVRFVERKIPGPGGRACARALAAAPAKARGTLRRWATWQGIRLVMRVTARKQQRKIDYSMRVAPVIGVVHGGQAAHRADSLTCRKAGRGVGSDSINGGPRACGTS